MLSSTHQPQPGMSDQGEITATMRITIFKAENLPPKDLNGLSDPYVKVSIGGHTYTTNVVKKNLNPIWNVSYDFDLESQSVPNHITLMFWDKDRIGKDDFMGIVNIPFDKSSIWSDGVPKHYDDPENTPKWFPLGSLPGKSSKVSGEVQVQFGFIDSVLAPSNEYSRERCSEVWRILSESRNILGLGQRTIRSPTDNTVISMADIPMAGPEVDPSLGHSDSNPESSSSPAGPPTNSLNGIVFLEVVSAANLPKLHNMTRTGFDMDPFVVISFGKYIFRTRVIRHNLNPVWKAKLMFRVHHGEEMFQIKCSIHDWDKLSGNDHVGSALLNVKDLIQAANTSDDIHGHVNGESASDGTNEPTDPDMKDFVLKIDLYSGLKVTSEDPQLRIRAKFVPYITLRRRFWYSLVKSYNTNNQSGLYNKVLIQTMLEGLGSTLSSKTIDGFFAPFKKDPEGPGLTFDELFERLEAQVRVDDGVPKEVAETVTKKLFNFSRFPKPSKGSDKNTQEGEKEEDAELYVHLTRNQPPSGSNPEALDIEEPTEEDFEPQTSEEEYLVRISTCPICHDSSLCHKTETDVITHIAVCSGNDGFNLDKLILGNFVTEANAQRKWITKVVKSLGYGRYGSNKSNANIIVQDRATGMMLEEKMPTFVRLGIRLLYKSPANKIHVNKILADMSRRQGLKFDDPRSKRDIEPFIRFHNLEVHMKEVLEPIENFRNFNEFFYRKLKSDARALSFPGDERVAVSVADCRMTCFQTISDATRFWIKGREFTIKKMLGDEELAKKFDGGSLAIFRLAPQDYHRYHIPVKGILSEPKEIAGTYYTVNPMAIRSQLDVYGENRRVISTLESKEFGTVAYVAIGAMMVGSIVLTTRGGQAVERMDEHGYFAFGGSTIVVLFEPNSIQFDEDLLQSSKNQIEMLVRVGMRIGISNKN